LKEANVKKQKRTEITAFRRRISIVSGGSAATGNEGAIRIHNAHSSDSIDIGSEEGQEILVDAIRVLQGNLQIDPSLD